MDHSAANVMLYIFGITSGIIISYYLYNWSKRKPLIQTNIKSVLVALNIVVAIVGFIAGFVALVIVYTILYLIFNGGKF